LLCACGAVGPYRVTVRSAADESAPDTYAVPILVDEPAVTAVGTPRGADR
jgi:hypothetical protein